MSAHARHVRTRTPCAHLVGRDVLGAPRPQDDIGDAHGDAGRRGRRPLPRSTPHPHGRARRPRRVAPTERHRGRPRARGPPGTSAPTTHRATSAHAPRHVRQRTLCAHTHAMRAPGRARRPRRAVAHENAIADAHGRAGRRDVGPYHAPRHVRTRTPRAAHARHVRTRTPCAHLVRRDVLGAPLPTGRHRGRPHVRGPPGTSAPTTHHATSAHAPRHIRTRTPRPHTHAMRAPGRARRPRRAAPTERPRDDIGDAHGYAGRRGRRPLPRSAPCPHTHTARRTRTPHPHTHAMRAPMVGRDVLGAPLPTRTPSQTPTCTRAAGTSAPTTFHTTPPW